MRSLVTPQHANHAALGERAHNALVRGSQPKPISEDVGTHEPTEEGLSIDPEEMGQSTGDQPARGVAEIDLTKSVIEEASLLDDEADVQGEVIPKQPRTEDSGHHTSRR